MLARDAQALIVAQIYLSVHPSVCPSVCPRQLVTRVYAALRVASHLDYRLVYISLCRLGSQKVMNGFWFNFVQGLGMTQRAQELISFGWYSSVPCVFWTIVGFFTTLWPVPNHAA